MILSLNEIEATIVKAARGAGMEWGLAEEAAQAARWLARRGVRFEAAFLELFETTPWRAEIVVGAGAVRPRNRDAWLCPIQVGACLSDLAPTPPLRVERVMQPLLLLPFVARLGTATLRWDDVGVTLCGSEIDAGLIVTCGHRGDRAEIVKLGVSAVSSVAPIAVLQDATAVDEAFWPKFQTFEMRTYVPATLRSRLSGAGSTIGDND